MEPVIGRLGALDAVSTRPAAQPAQPSAGGFGNALSAALDRVSAEQSAATQLSREFQMDNDAVGIEETMIALTKASLGFQAAVQVRNKLVSAYNDVMNMPL